MTVIDLQVGAHSSPDDGVCLLEAVSYFAGEFYPCKEANFHKLYELEDLTCQ
jgi:hypothetical protein